MPVYSIPSLLLMLIPLVLVSGSLTIAIIDPAYRQPFMDLSKVFLGGMVGLMIPSEGVSLRRRVR